MSYEDYTLTCPLTEADETMTRLLNITTAAHMTRIDCTSLTVFILSLTEDQALACRATGIPVEVDEMVLGTCDRVECYLVCSETDIEQYKLALGVPVKQSPWCVGRVALVMTLNGPEFEQLRVRFPSLREGRPVMTED